MNCDLIALTINIGTISVVDGVVLFGTAGDSCQRLPLVITSIQNTIPNVCIHTDGIRADKQARVHAVDCDLQVAFRTGGSFLNIEDKRGILYRTIDVNFVVGTLGKVVIYTFDLDCGNCIFIGVIGIIIFIGIIGMKILGPGSRASGNLQGCSLMYGGGNITCSDQVTQLSEGDILLVIIVVGIIVGRFFSIYVTQGLIDPQAIQIQERCLGFIVTILILTLAVIIGGRAIDIDLVSTIVKSINTDHGNLIDLLSTTVIAIVVLENNRHSLDGFIGISIDNCNNDSCIAISLSAGNQLKAGALELKRCEFIGVGNLDLVLAIAAHLRIGLIRIILTILLLLIHTLSQFGAAANRRNVIGQSLNAFFCNSCVMNCREVILVVYNRRRKDGDGLIHLHLVGDIDGTIRQCRRRKVNIVDRDRHPNLIEFVHEVSGGERNCRTIVDLS